MTMKSKVISLLMSLTLVLSVTTLSFAQSEQIPELTNGEELIDEVVEEIVEEGDFTEEQIEQIEDEIDSLYSSYVPVDNIVDVVVDEETEEISYEVEYSEGITNEISVNLDCKDGVELLFTENNLHDELIFADNGDVILNGDVVVTEDVFESDDEDEVDISTGGIKWSTKKHTSKQATAYGKEGLRSCSKNVKFQKKLGDFTVGAITGIMMAKLGLGTVWTQAVLSYVSGDVASLKKSYAQSHSMSYKKYISSAIKPKKTTRYLKARYLLYGKINYGGDPKTRYLYGTYI